MTAQIVYDQNIDLLTITVEDTEFEYNNAASLLLPYLSGQYQANILGNFTPTPALRWISPSYRVWVTEREPTYINLRYKNKTYTIPIPWRIWFLTFDSSLCTLSNIELWFNTRPLNLNTTLQHFCLPHQELSTDHEAFTAYANVGVEGSTLHSSINEIDNAYLAALEKGLFSHDNFLQKNIALNVEVLFLDDYFFHLESETDINNFMYKLELPNTPYSWQSRRTTLTQKSDEDLAGALICLFEAREDKVIQ